MFPADVVLSGSVFHRVRVPTEKASVLVFVVTLGTATKFEHDDRQRSH